MSMLSTRILKLDIRMKDREPVSPTVITEKTVPPRPLSLHPHLINGVC